MESKTIFSCLKIHPKTRKSFYGIYPYDTLPHKNYLLNKKPIVQERYVVVNTDKAENTGKHWYALCLCQEGGIHEYFDSYGSQPSDFIKEYFNDNFFFLDVPIQNELTTTCGQWCMYYILYKCNGGQLNCFIQHLKEKESNPLLWDEYIAKEINTIFPVKEPVMNTDFLIDQIALKREM